MGYYGLISVKIPIDREIALELVTNPRQETYVIITVLLGFALPAGIKMLS